jgi:hypothetical protein
VIFKNDIRLFIAEIISLFRFPIIWIMAIAYTTIVVKLKGEVRLQRAKVIDEPYTNPEEISNPNNIRN